MYNENKEYRFRKLYISIPAELFDKIREEGFLPKIDEICTDLLRDYLKN
jgi:hypothetical protein